MNKENEMQSCDVHNFKIIEINNKEKIDAVISECDSAFPTPIKTRIGYSDLLEKFSTYACFACVRQNDTLGYIAFYVNNKNSAYVSLIAVQPQYQNQHIGSILLGYCEKKAQDKGINSVRLEVKKENQKAISFYQAHGYRWEKDKNENSAYMIKNI